MNFSVVIDDLTAHGRDVREAGSAAASTLGAVRLDAAASALPGSLSAPQSTEAISDFFRGIMAHDTSQWLEDGSPVHDFFDKISRFYPEGSGTIHTYHVEVGRQ